MTEVRLMEGFPPASAGQVTLANWRSAPYLRWSFQHVREIVPSADIPNDSENIWKLDSTTMSVDGLSFEHLGVRYNLRSFLETTDTDGFVVLHRGRVVFEHYANGMARSTPHLWMSVSKSLLGMLCGVLAEKGVLKTEDQVSRYVPEIGRTAYASATLRDLLDMRAGIQFEENYAASSGLIIEYRKSHNWRPLDPGDVPSDLRSFYQLLNRSDGKHGRPLHYVSPNTDLLGWVIERASGQRYADLVSELIWKPMGAAHSAYITVDRLGAPRCAGGVCSTLTDLARLGRLIAEDGRRDGRQVVPVQWISDVLEEGDPDAWLNGDLACYFEDGMPIHYRSKWYVFRGEKPMMFGLGIHGQNLFVDAARQVVIAKVSSQAPALDKGMIGLTMSGVDAIRRHLNLT